jgi:hypothetical protein
MPREPLTLQKNLYIMNKPKANFWIWLSLKSLLLFIIEWAIGTVILYYTSKWLGFGVTTQRVLATLWLLLASLRATARYSRHKRVMLLDMYIAGEIDTHPDDMK